MLPSAQILSLAQLTALQWQQFAKRRSNWLVLLVFTIAGFYALYQGYTDKRAKTNTIQAFRQEKDSLLQDMIAGINADTLTEKGKAKYNKSAVPQSGLWNTKLPSWKLPVSTAIYNIGQSDVFTYYYLFSAENFEMQLLKQTEINNPLRALAGHFDISFWLIYLLPLMILLFTFNVLSAERDNGNWRLIAAQGISEKRWLQSRFVVIGCCCIFLLLLIAVTGTIINTIVFKQPPAFSDLLFFLTAHIYLFFWLSLFYFINSLRRPTAYNALISGIAWISICLVIPVLISKLADVMIPVDNTQVSTFSRRPQNPQIEASKDFATGLIKQFGAAFPPYKNANTDTASPAFMLCTYHAWHTILTKKRWPIIQQYFADIEQRQRLTNWSSFINPAGSTDGFFTSLADNDVMAFHQFIEQTEQLHSALQDVLYPALFADKPLTKADYNGLPQFQYRRSTIPLLLAGYFLLMLFTSSCFVNEAGKKLNTLKNN